MQTAFTVHQTLSFPVMKTEEMYYPLSMVWRECISQKKNKLSLILREVFLLMLQQTSVEKPHPLLSPASKSERFTWQVKWRNHLSTPSGKMPRDVMLYKLTLTKPSLELRLHACL